MQKNYALFLFILLFSSSVFSQALPNPGFDNWTNNGFYDNPDNWNTLNSSTFAVGVLTCLKATGAEIHSGAAAIKLITQFVPGFNLNATGLATTGTINVSLQTVDGGIPYTLRPDSITGWYKCAPLGADSGFVDFTLLDAQGTDTVGFAHFQAPGIAVTTFTYFSVAINYHNANTPALARCVMSSSVGLSSVVNSVLIIDDLALVFLPNVVREPVFSKSTVSYNSAMMKLHVNTDKHSKITVVDMTGKKIFEAAVEAGNSDFSLSGLQAGLYVYMLTDDALKSASSGKFTAE